MSCLGRFLQPLSPDKQLIVFGDEDFFVDFPYRFHDWSPADAFAGSLGQLIDTHQQRFNPFHMEMLRITGGPGSQAATELRVNVKTFLEYLITLVSGSDGFRQVMMH
ncbi:hypothetical protein D3C86_1924550 [compost metagenome]